MFIPEYSITSEILKNIATIEYGKALIENTPILPHWEKQLQKEAKIKTVINTLNLDGVYVDKEAVKRYLDGIEKNQIHEEIRNFVGGLRVTEEINSTSDIDESNILALHKIVTEDLISPLIQGRYRSKKFIGHTSPEEILAEIVETFDWYNSLDAKETYPIIASGILYGRILSILPFESFNTSVATLIAKISLRISGYSTKNFISPEENFQKNKNSYQRSLDSINQEDFTEFLEYYTQAYASEVATMKEKIMLLSRDTKVVKASGTLDLTPRQARIVEYLQDYKLLQNKDFSRLFEGVSEDSVLRDLKVLVEKGIVIKSGKTKSSKYELK